MAKLDTLNLAPDDRNANRGTERGRALLERSLKKFGAGRSILVDKNGRIIAGNKTHEVAVALGLKATVVESVGDTVVVVQRADIDIDSAEGRELAIADNRVAELNLDWDRDVLAEMEAEGINVRDYWHDWEGWTNPEHKAGKFVAAADPGDAVPDSDRRQVLLFFSSVQLAEFEALIEAFRATEGDSKSDMASVVLKMLEVAA